MAPIDAKNCSGLTVAIVGAECSGKTTLARALAQHFAAPWVPEYARDYLHGRTSYDEDDVLAIAAGQCQTEANIADANDLVFVDTDLVVIKIWHDVRFGGHNAWLDAALHADLHADRPRRYLLTTPDIPWIADPLRENPFDRPALHARYRPLLDLLGAKYVEVSGSREQRLDRATGAVRGWLNR